MREGGRRTQTKNNKVCSTQAPIMQSCEQQNIKIRPESWRKIIYALAGVIRSFLVANPTSY